MLCSWSVFHINSVEEALKQAFQYLAFIPGSNEDDQNDDAMKKKKLPFCKRVSF